MQTLTRSSVFPCYAPEDRKTAAALAEFLERGADVEVMLEDGEIRPGEDLVSKARDARTADIILVLFSRNSLPPRWARAQWEDALLKEPESEGIRIAFARCDDCNPPAVLKPSFDLRGSRLGGMREAKRWVRGRGASWSPPEEPRDEDHAGYLEDLAIALADRPGFSVTASPALAYELARSCCEDFDEIFRLECAGRSLAALAGDLGAQLGLQLQGQTEENLERIAAFCRPRRYLILLEGGGSDAFAFGGRCSTLFIEETGPPSASEIRTCQQALSEPRAAGGWSEICRLARMGRRVTRDAGRLAECFEMMQQWNALAEEQEDLAALDESAREMVWILDAWDRSEEARALEFRRAGRVDQQLPLDLF